MELSLSGTDADLYSRRRKQLIITVLVTLVHLASRTAMLSLMLQVNTKPKSAESSVENGKCIAHQILFAYSTSYSDPHLCVVQLGVLDLDRDHVSVSFIYRGDHKIIS